MDSLGPYKKPITRNPHLHPKAIRLGSKPMGMLEFPITAGKLAAYLNAPILGDPEALIERVGSVQNSNQRGLCYLADKKAQHFLSSLVQGSVVLTKKDWVREELPITYVLVNEPKSVFAQIAKSFEPKSQWMGISDKAVIHPEAEVSSLAHVAPFAVICEGAKVGSHAVIYPHAYVGPGVQIGEWCEVHSQVVLVANVTLGDRVRVLAGSVLGSDGFGLIEGNLGHQEMPQVGTVIIENDVRIGAKCTIDRGTLGETRIGSGSKLDDQVHVGHNCIVGKNVILCAQVGLAGSSVIEDGVVLAGQVGVGDHIRIGKGARVGGQTGVTQDLPGNETYFSTPAVPLKQALRSHVLVKNLSELVGRVRALEKKINGNADGK